MIRKLYVLLGRTGDVLAGLPLLYHDSLQGNRPCLMIGYEYAPIMDGISWCDRIIWGGLWSEVRGAVNSVKYDFNDIVVLQQYSTDGWPVVRKCDSFVLDMYRIAGKTPLFGSLPLTFDLRDKAREANLVACSVSIKPDLRSLSQPIILLATTGFSSPFLHGKDLLDMLERSFPNVFILDMDTVRGHRIYDLLALFERAAVLVTVDSALLHLAQATPNLPVVALVTDKPTRWHGSPKYTGQILRIRYFLYSQRRTEIVHAIKSLDSTETHTRLV